MTARRIVFPATLTCELEEIDFPEKPDENKVLIETVTSLISPGTEVSMFNRSHSGFDDRDNAYAKYPFYPGYATCGKVIAVGPDVKLFKKEQRVLTMGGHVSHQLQFEQDLLPCPTSLSPEEVPFARLAAIPLNGIRHAAISLGTSVAVVGQGLIGLLALFFAKMAGAYPLIAVDLSEQRLGLSQQLGADEVINPAEQDLREKIGEITKNRMMDRVIEVTGLPLIPQNLELLSKGGILYLLGGPHGKVGVNFYSHVLRNNLSIIGGHENGAPESEDYHFPWTRRANMEFCLELMEEKRLNVRPLITDHVSPVSVPQLFFAVDQDAEDHLGMIIEWQR